ncbi:leucine--tRNA ligase [Dehalococcoides mccartyi]|uniref:Leucine--tRNA ligase n=1 Tax=Dehalococcoides mccartyi (strain VS) TaxID=311424 RepID=D2BGA3_DEHMV|nr:leucine--tRNA ligase [Dehalococcoides mccartyi]ACZ61353.1 leucyl-tRNA synthetase [Dehalococcoides mccartyi VS]
MAEKYNPQETEKKWQDKWAADRLYHASEDSPKPKWYSLTMFPYTSGNLHIGHWYAEVPADCFARYKRLNGFNVMRPVGFDSFGLPAENAAIKHHIHPRIWTLNNVENMRRQLKTIGAMFDWDREVITCLPEYYKWTQWFFLKLYEAGLAYRAKAPVNWCPSCQAVLANEQVVDGTCWRCETPTTRRDLEQWFFRITNYADELKDHEGLDWPEKITAMQRNWVGKSYGAEVSFALDCPAAPEQEIKVFTTRPDTIYGVTFMVLAPEHSLVEKITTPENKAAVDEYIKKSRACTEIERLSTEREKDGVFTGAYVTNRVNGHKVPVWIGDYVLQSYGTGAVMGVPAHDERDFVFAQKYHLPVITVIAPPDYDGQPLEAAYINEGVMQNSGPFNGLPNTEGKEKVSDYLAEHGWGKKTVNYKLRDWLISRQRYWGAPIPMVYCEKCGIVPVPEKDLPVLLPEDVEFRSGGESPLKYNEGFVNTTCPVCGGKAKRETDTMDTFMCSSWYFLRYTSPGYDKGPFDPEKLRYWMPVDLYTGGAEHAVMHLFYSRFFTKALRDMGIIDFGEPFKKLFNQGIIVSNHQKMSKSKGNVVTPDNLVAEVGTDAVRAYLMFVGPWDQGGEWNDSGLSGMSRWLNRVWNLFTEEYTPKTASAEAERELKRTLHQTIKKITMDIERLRFNTVVAALMELSNSLAKFKEAAAISAESWQNSLKTFALMLAPIAPHIAEELWANLGMEYSIHNQSWPKWDEELAKDEVITLIIQVNGKLRERLEMPAGISEDEAKETALNSARVKPHLQGKTPASVIYVPGKLVNIVVK